MKSERRSSVAFICSMWLLAVACGSPSTPAPIPAPAPANMITLTGHVTATNGGQPLAGVTATLDTTPVTTDATGTFAGQLFPESNAILQLSSAAIVPRRLTVAASASRNLSVSAIALGAGFDLTFYRELVRNAFEGGNEPLRRWPAAPNVYLRTIRDDTAEAIDGGILDLVEQTIRDTMPRWSGFSPASFVRGADTRAGQAGWITITWPHAAAADHICGLTDIAVSGGLLRLYVPTATSCSCSGTVIAPRIIRHELGHAMGFWHTDSPNDVMVASSSACDIPISARELAHAAIAYARPVGNLDPDTDPVTAVSLTAIRVP